MAFLALRTGRAVRLVLTLEETFQQVRRASARTHVRTGFDASGRIVFQDIHADFLIGAYADVGGRVVSKASYAACGPYRTPNARVAARALLSHTTPSTAFRGFGTPQASWAVESQLNAAAAALGLDRLEIRRRNVAKKGEAFIPGDTPADGDWERVLLAAGDAIGWTDPLPANRGRGVSLGLKSSSTASSSFAIARLHYDGSASILSGTSDMGQGARTVLKQIAAEELGIAPERIAIVMGDTSVVPFDSSTSASRSTVFMGNAVTKACRDVKEKLKHMAVRTFGVDESDVRVGDGLVRMTGREIDYEQLLHASFGPPRGEVIGVGHEANAYDAAHPLGGRPAFWEMMCAAAEVEVDPEVGMVQIVKLVLVSDIGKALNPQQVEAQDEGAAVMGLGHTFMEQLLLDDRGRIRNLGALDYRIPTIRGRSRDAPLDPDRERRRPWAPRSEGSRRRRDSRDRGGRRRGGQSGGRHRASRPALDTGTRVAGGAGASAPQARPPERSGARGPRERRRWGVRRGEAPRSIMAQKWRVAIFGLGHWYSAYGLAALAA